MPLFEYYCNVCEINFELLLLTNDAKKSMNCLKCGTHKTKKRLSSFSTAGSQNDITKDTAT